MATQTFNEPAKVKVVTDISNVPLGDAELGEMYYDLTTNYLNIRIDSGWKYIAMT